MDVLSWKQMHGESVLIESIRASHYELFKALLDSGVDINSNDYLYSRDGRLPTLPIHVAAANADSRFLRTLIELGADPDDSRADPCGPYPQFDNVFRTAVRAGQWENVKFKVVDAGGVQGDIGCDRMWELHMQFLKEEIEEDDEEIEEEIISFVNSLLHMSWNQLSCLQPPHIDSHQRQRCWNAIASGTDHYDDEELHELTDLDWTIGVNLPHLDYSHRLSIIDRLLCSGANMAAALHRASPTLYTSPMSPLGPSYHTVSTPLHTCVLRGNAALLTHLISTWQFNPNIPEFSTRAYTPLFLALSRADLHMAAAVLNAGGHVDYVSPIMGVTVLHVAAATRNAEVLRWVLDQLWNIERTAAECVYEQRSLLRHTPLHVACLPSFSSDFDVWRSEAVRYALPSEPSHPSEPSQDFLDVLIAAGDGRWRWTDEDHLGCTALEYRESCRQMSSV
ncbi:hypothetical protein EW146_g6284 [Bondarzewia mesenterica]|uniref:Ankyrin n=1 Tax=Bondarzewia mesenterica TaxID=1095465 RepID=A0A4S4LQ14_9AGAM|nr:hypothetical protein EW146_g6284 [Bondarzewia mesenterica]